MFIQTNMHMILHTYKYTATSMFTYMHDCTIKHNAIMLFLEATVCMLTLL